MSEVKNAVVDRYVLFVIAFSISTNQGLVLLRFIGYFAIGASIKRLPQQSFLFSMED